MVLKRVIPCLLLSDNGLVKTVKFKDKTYVGDPINAVKIFNEKEVDELIFLDIDATKERKEPPYELIRDIASECFMPFCYGGGVKSIDQIRKLNAAGAEKIAINSAIFYDTNFIKEAVNIFGSSTIVASIDYKKNIFGKTYVYINNGKKSIKKHPVDYAIEMEQLGVGEIMLNSIDRDGMMKGLDLEIIEEISNTVSIPVIACGGVGSLNDISAGFSKGNASAVAAGSFFVFQGKRRAVLISYPTEEEIKKTIGSV